ncbi:hypothetical protein EB837_23710 [Kluyvera ascorbata]|uniref:Uncharacterized protein n=1 Tax=Kluyvera ascorbata TaxID=51288 RepID=A0A3N2RQR9_9ENTR|nr:hypothetical protein EB837_23710 [Kluyvera ascorbata]
MSEFISDYTGAFKPGHTIGIRRWMFFSLKCVLLFLLLLLVFSVTQYTLIMYTPLFEYVTVPGIKQSNVYGITMILAVSFGPCLFYLMKGIVR